MPFKAYDIRGRVPDQIDEDFAFALGKAYTQVIPAQTVVIGYDIRQSSPRLKQALACGLTAGGAKVFDIGLCGTEEVYFATAHLKAGGGIMVTASHNPIDYNGFKLVRAGSEPISGDSGLKEIEQCMQRGHYRPDLPADIVLQQTRPDYVRHLLSFVAGAQLKPLKIVVNAGNGCAGVALDALAEHLPFEFVRVHHEADGTFPNGIPNPLLPENRAATAEAVIAHQADLGLAWDGDFDRCFFFDETGRFIEGYYIVGFLASLLLKSHPGDAVIHDPRLIWNTLDLVEQAKGRPVECKTGHAFIKERMRKENAVYGGEMSAHHYFRDFFYCDSGMIPWLLIARQISESGQPFSQLIDDRMQAFPCSGEINFVVSDTTAVLNRVQQHYQQLEPKISRIDGISYEFAEWRFNLRSSNTEPVMRLNVETRANPALLEARTAELKQLITGDRND
jgi:phosphomannomutase